MGCGVSKSDTSEEGEGQQGSRTIRRRIEEMTRRSRTISTNTPSRKQLLPFVREDGDEHSPPDSPQDNPRKSVSVSENKGEVDAKLVKDVSVNEEKRTEVEKIEKRDHKDETREEEDGYNYEDDVDGPELAPGSPSFREYYVASVDNSLDSGDSCKDDDAHDGEKKEIKSRPKESSTSSEESITGSVKKGGKRRFRRGLPRGGQVAVKNFLNVKSCYIPSCATSHEHSQILNAKVSAA